MSLASRRKKIAQLFVANYSHMRRQLRKHVDAQGVDDALQQAFLQLMEKPPKGLSGDPIGYFYATAVNSSRALRRRHARHTYDIDHLAVDDSVTSELDREMLEREVTAALDAITERERTAVKLLMEGLTYQQAARVMKVTLRNFHRIIAGNEKADGAFSQLRARLVQHKQTGHQRIGLHRVRRERHWTAEEDALILGKTMQDWELAQALKASNNSIWRRRRELRAEQWKKERRERV